MSYFFNFFLSILGLKKIKIAINVRTIEIISNKSENNNLLNRSKATTIQTIITANVRIFNYYSSFSNNSNTFLRFSLSSRLEFFGVSIIRGNLQNLLFKRFLKPSSPILPKPICS